MRVVNSRGELRVANRGVDTGTVLFNTDDGKYYQWTPASPGNAVVGYWKEVTDYAARLYNPDDGKNYYWKVASPAGVLTGYWDEIT